MPSAINANIHARPDDITARTGSTSVWLEFGSPPGHASLFLSLETIAAIRVALTEAEGMLNAIREAALAGMDPTRPGARLP